MMSLCRRCLLLLIALLGSGARAGWAQASLPPAFNPANGHWYQLVRAPRINWRDARAAAQALFFAGYRGHLGTVTSPEENRFVAGYLSANGPLGDIWLGGFQDRTARDYSEPAGGWRWVTGEPWSFTSWSGGEPNNAGGTEDVLETNSGGTWNDLTEGVELTAYLVEYEPPAAPGAPRLAILPNPVAGGQTTVGQVVLDRPAAPGDGVVTLTSSSAGVAAVPALVLVPAGTSTALFSIVTFAVSAPTAVAIAASGPGGSRTATVQVLPAGAAFPPGNLLANGSFEQPRVRPGQAVDALPGWRTAQGCVDVIPAAVWQAAPGEGDQSLDLVGDCGRQPSAAVIEQSFATTAGREYIFSGWIAHNPGNPTPEGRANVSLNGQFFVQLFHRDTRATPRDMRWTRFAYRFRAVGAMTTLTVADITGTWEKGGLALDGLAVPPVPPNLLVNGSFEEPDISAAPQGSRAVGSGGLPGWEVRGGTVDLVHQHTWQAAPGQGSQSLHLLGRSGAAGVIEQSIPTEPGRSYVLSGWVSHHPNVTEGRVNVFLNGELLTQLYHSSALYGPQSPAEMRWQPFLYRFAATGETTRLQLVDATGLSETEGAVLDGLAVAPAEEPAPGLPPAAPTGLTVRLVSPTQVELSWKDNSSDETGFEIQRKNGTGDWMRIAVVAANVTRFSDFGVNPNSSYGYRVRAVNDSGASGWSNEAAVTTLP